MLFISFVYAFVIFEKAHIVDEGLYSRDRSHLVFGQKFTLPLRPFVDIVFKLHCVLYRDVVCVYTTLDAFTNYVYMRYKLYALNLV